MRAAFPAFGAAALFSGHLAEAWAATAPIEVQILAFNDFHGNLEPPKLAVVAPARNGRDVAVPAGGVAYMAGALDLLRRGSRHSITVSAGDLIGGSPLTSALFLDEPTILAMNALRLDLNAVGNHEFDRGREELLRMQNGGCRQHTRRKPCALEPFAGATFSFLGANVMTESSETLFPATAIRQFGPVRIGFIGVTLKETGSIVTPSGVRGLRFEDEAASANAMVPRLKAEGADAIVLLIHQGGRTDGHFDDRSCPGLAGPILPILERLDPSVLLVVSGHTHRAYACELPLPRGGGTRLLTSSGQYGTLLTDIRLRFTPETKTLTGKSARFFIVQGEPFSSQSGETALTEEVAMSRADPEVAAIVDRYAAAARPLADRVVARLDAPISARRDDHGSQRLGELIADAQLAWTRSSGAQLALMNQGGVRSDLVPASDGRITYGQIFAVQPFGNGVVVQTLTGAQLKSLLEQQFPPVMDDDTLPKILAPSAGFRFDYDLRRPPGERIISMSLNGRAIEPAGLYRVATNSFLASGGDGFTVLKDGSERHDSGNDLDALEAWLAANPPIPSGDRVRSLSPAAAGPERG